MKILSTIVVFTCFAHFSYAQGANVNIEQNPKIDQLLEIYKSSLSNNEYYRIQVGFGNYAKAQKIKANVEEDFPDLSSKIDFKNLIDGEMLNVTQLNDSTLFATMLGELEREDEFNKLYGIYSYDNGVTWVDEFLIDSTESMKISSELIRNQNSDTGLYSET